MAKWQNCFSPFLHFTISLFALLAWTGEALELRRFDRGFVECDGYFAHQVIDPGYPVPLGKVDVFQFNEIHLLFDLHALAVIHDPIDPVLPKKTEKAVSAGISKREITVISQSPELVLSSIWVITLKKLKS